jgi:hypothetical protein
MAYSAVADSGRDYGGANGFRPPGGYLKPGNGELRKKIGSMEHAPSVDSPNQVRISLIRLLIKVEACGTFLGVDCVSNPFRLICCNVRGNACEFQSTNTSTII